MAKRGNDLHPSLWIKLAKIEALKEQKGCCIYCKTPLRRSEATADHKRPKKRGGSDARENIAAACAPCNHAKGHMWETKFWRLIKGNNPPTNSPDLMLIWASRRIWKRTHKACERIERRAK